MSASAEPTDRPSTGPPLFTRHFAGILLTQAVFGFSISMFQLLPTFLASELGASASEMGLVASCFGFATVLVTPLMGEAVDRLGRRHCLALGAGVMALSSLAFMAVEELGPLVYGLRALQGASFGIAFVAGSTLAVDHAPPERLAQTLGLFGLTMLSMNAVGPVVTEELAARFGWEYAFATAALGSTACLLLVYAMLREPRRALPRDGSAPSLWAVARRPRQLRSFPVMLITAAACGVMFTFHQPFALELGMERVGSFFAAYASAAILVRLALGGFVDRVGRHRVARSCLALYATAVTGMAGLGAVGLVPLGALFGVAHGLFFPALNAIVVADSGVHERGKVMALFIGTFNLGFALGPLSLGYLADARGFPVVFGLTGALTFGALALFLASPESRAPQPTSSALSEDAADAESSRSRSRAAG